MSDDSRRWKEFRQYLHAITRQRIPDAGAEDCSDLVQRTLLEAHQQHSAGNSPSEPRHFRHWLRRILCCNLADAARDARRQKRDARRETRLDARDLRSAETPELIDDQTSPSQRVSRDERKATIRALVTELPKTNRRVIQMRFFEQRRIAEIAEAVGLSESAVAGLIFRSLRLLKSDLADGDVRSRQLD